MRGWLVTLTLVACAASARAERAEPEPLLPFALGDYAGKSGALFVGVVERVTFGTLFAADGTVRVFVINVGPEGHSLTTYRIVPAAMAKSTLFETYGVQEKGTTATLTGSKKAWKLARSGKTIRIDDGTHAPKLTAVKLAAAKPVEAPALLERDREVAAAFATGGVEAWVAASTTDGGAFHWISGLALGTAKVREALDEAKPEMGKRTPRLARISPSGKLGVTLGTAIGGTAFAYLTLWQRDKDNTWRMLLSTLHMPQ